MTRPVYDELEVGTALPQHVQTVCRQDLVRYAAASGDLNTIHWDEKAALDAGLPDVIAHGMFTMGVAARALSTWAGDAGHVLSYSTRFSRPVIVPRTAPAVQIVVDGKVVEKLESPNVRVDLTVRCGTDKVLTRTRAVVAVEA